MFGPQSVRVDAVFSCITHIILCSVVCVLGTRASCAKTADQIAMLFQRQARVGQRNFASDGGPNPHGNGHF